MKRRIARYLILLTAVIAVFLLAASVVIQIALARRSTRAEATLLFSQIEQVLTKSESDLAQTREEYRTSCLHRADTIAHVIALDPTLTDGTDDVEELRALARMVEVDEINLFDAAGAIVNGTHPAYFGYTMDSGEQIAFFKPMLTDKTLRLYQDVTPNTAAATPMQYSAVWDETGTWIVEIGMKAVTAARTTEKSELFYVFSLLATGVEADLYAADPATGEILGATDAASIGKRLADLGVNAEKYAGDAVIDGAWLADWGFCAEKLASERREEEQYLKIDQITQNNDVFGVIVDMTPEINKRRQVESERDRDALTGIYNRRGFYRQLDKLFADPEAMAYGALVMIDADGLKQVNDTYGHLEGDLYIQKIAELLGTFGAHGVAARFGGDEFALLLYGYGSERELAAATERLARLQDEHCLYLDNGTAIPVRFSAGARPTRGAADFRPLLRAADEVMYRNKRERKEQRNPETE